MEQRELERKFGKKKAKEVAQQNFEVEFPKEYRFMRRSNIKLYFFVSSNWVDTLLSSACIGGIYSIYSICTCNIKRRKTSDTRKVLGIG